MAKKKISKISQRRQAQNKQRGLLEVWIDGCYFDQEQKAGGAGVICDADGKVQRTISFELNHAAITESNHAELWTAALVLSAMEKSNVGQLSTDCPAVRTAIDRIRTGKPSKIIDQELYDALCIAVRSQPNMAINQRTRGQGKIPVADRFAKAAARADLGALEAASRATGNHPHTHTPSPKPQAPSPE